MSRRISVAFALAVLLSATLASVAGAATVTEYNGGLSETAQPVAITTGPDGNLWFAMGGEKSVDSMTLNGGAVGHKTNAKLVDVAPGPDGKVWFVASEGTTELGTVDPSTGKVTEYALSGSVGGITGGPEGDLWFTVENAGGEAAIGRAVPSTGAIKEFKIGSSSKPAGITVGPEGNLWFTEPNANGGNGAIGSFNPNTQQPHEYTTVNGLTVKSGPNGIATGSDGNVWFTEVGAAQIGRIDPGTGAISQFGGLTEGKPESITAASDGNLYFTESGGEGGVGQITPSGTITEYKGGTTGLSKKAEPWGITSGPDGNVWFTEKAKPAAIGELTIAPSVSSPTAGNIGSQQATLGATIGANAQATYYFFEYGATAAYGSFSTTGSAGNGGLPISVSALIGGLSAATTYHFRAVAVNAAGTSYGADATFTSSATTASSGGAPSGGITPSPFPTGGPESQPVLGSTAAAQPESGTVLVQQPSGAYAPLTSVRTVPLGTVIDATHGSIRLLTATDTHGGKQAVTIWGGVFELRQAGASTHIILKGTSPSCSRAGRAHTSSTKAHVKSRKLWAADNHGKYSTYGANSVATVLGTKWETEDTCAGTRTRVLEGKVSVRDLHRHKTVLVGAGRSYLARH